MKPFVLAAIFLSAAFAQAPPETLVASLLDGTKVTAGDVARMMENAPPRFLQGLKTNPQQAIQEYYLFKYLLEKAESEKLAEKSPVKEQLETQRTNALVQGMINWEQDHFPISEETINAFYQQNISRYEQSRIKVIFLAFKAGANKCDPNDLAGCARAALEQAHPLNDRSEEEAKTFAEDLVKQIRGGADFKKLVALYSDDATSKSEGGDFGVVKINSSLPQDMKQAVLRLKAGEVSDPIKQPSGYYIVLVEEKTAQPAKELMEPIVQELRAAHMNEWLSQLTGRFQPKIENPGFFGQLLQPPTPAPQR